MGLQDPVGDQIARGCIRPFVDDYHVVVKVEGKDVAVVVSGFVTRNQVFGMVQAVGELPEKRYGRPLRPRYSLPAVAWPVSSLDVLHHVDPASCQQGEKDFKGRDDVLVHVAAVINDQIEIPGLTVNALQTITVSLGTLVDPDSASLVRRLIINVQGMDAPFVKIITPHLKGLATSIGIVITPDPNFQECYRETPEFREMTGVNFDIVMAKDFVRPIEFGQSAEIPSPQPSCQWQIETPQFCVICLGQHFSNKLQWSKNPNYKPLKHRIACYQPSLPANGMASRLKGRTDS